MMSFVDNDSTYERLRKVIADFFAKQLEEEIDQLWQKGILNEDKVESFRTLHERTAY